MDTIEYQRATTLGLGRAVLNLDQHDSNPYREIILDACLHNRAHDAQVEGSRAKYMLEIIQRSGDLRFFADAILRSLSDREDDWNTPQRFGIARLLAQDGYPGIREAMYSAFRTLEISASDVASEFIELDGIQGALFVIAQIGSQIGKNPLKWEDEYLLSVVTDKCGKDAVDSALNAAAENDQNVRAYIAGVEENRRVRAAIQKPDPSDMTYIQIRSLIETNKAAGALRKWAQTATDPDLECAARDLVQETDPGKLKSYLTIFRNKRFPLDPNYLLRLVGEPEGPIARHALSALACVDDDEVRRLAFSLVAMGSPLRAYAIDLLVKNFHNGDHMVVEGWCIAEQDADIVNALDRSHRDFFGVNPNPDSEKRILRVLYEKEPCAHCRNYIVERLIELDALPDELRLECKHDSYAETRELVKGRVN
jgi:hypothetical protein